LRCPFSVVADSTSLYWSDPQTTAIAKVPSAGGSTTTLVSSTGSPAVLAVDGVDVYYATSSGTAMAVQRIPVDGGAPTTLVAPPVADIASMAVDDTSVYFIGTSGLYKVTPK